MATGSITLAFFGDVMTGRGVDQILPHPGDPVLRESYIKDAGGYVRLAELESGPIRRPVDFDWPWGDVLDVLAATAPDARVMNLETAVTRCADFAPDKVVHYRMNPANVPCLTAARPDAVVVANNHVLDFGRDGLAETLDTLAGAGLRTAGAGPDEAAAERPAEVPIPGGRLLVFAFGTTSSGIPPAWAAGPDRPGVYLMPERPDAAAAAAARMRAAARPGDIVVASVHWGSNWGYEVPGERVAMAHALVDGGVDVVFGHSSHHPRPVEVYRDRLVMYGCGDFIDDYEGISGYEEYRDDLRLLYLVSLEPDGRLAGLRMVPFRSRQMRNRLAPDEDVAWLRGLLNRVGREFGTRVDGGPDGMLTLRTGRD
ncbi:putative polyglutamine synthesis accessory protein [Sphaerisporangium rufum]|uniref:Polyglutamine synthesis accessory protein n=1 Tax=Sphaerisporangium rufum TaxID=1381558 RepID=A0A919R0H2_9ACTN|nr:CapA family protein [Sphaerisporangium rufum]GII76156.1 putative polyglutamine synthesis accessory protein [Sphaerisporangium rufum]